MLIRLAAKTGLSPILPAGRAGVLDARDGQVGQEDFGQENEGNQLGHMTRTLFATSPFFCPPSSCPTPTWRLFVTQPDQHGMFHTFVFCVSFLRQHALHHIPRDIGEPVVAAAVAIG